MFWITGWTDCHLFQNHFLNLVIYYFYYLNLNQRHRPKSKKTKWFINCIRNQTSTCTTENRELASPSASPSWQSTVKGGSNSRYVYTGLRTTTSNVESPANANNMFSTSSKFFLVYWMKRREPDTLGSRSEFGREVNEHCREVIMNESVRVSEHPPPYFSLP